MKEFDACGRRSFLGRAGSLVSAALFLSPGRLLAQTAPSTPAGLTTKEAAAVEVSPMEDLMREHGLLSRVLLIYEEVLRQGGRHGKFPAEVVSASAGIIQRFIEQYHEKLEEEHLFPRFEKAGKLVDLVRTLREQHQAGRKLTGYIFGKSGGAQAATPGERRRMAACMHSFIRMYRPHKAREETVLFPAFHALVTPDEYDKLGDMFEDREQALFGRDGFEKMVEEVSGLEKRIGIYELSQFTSKL